MIIFGLIGAIGIGKSFVANCFRRFGAAIFDADSAVQRIYQSNKSIINLGKNYFPDTVIEGAISRPELRKYFFQNSKKWRIFESKVHALIIEQQNNFLIEEERKNRSLAVLDVPLLIEVKSHCLCDFIVFVTADSKLQNERLKKRSLKIEELDLFSKRQLTCHEKSELSNFTVNTSFSKEETFFRVKEIINSVCSIKFYV